MSLLTNSLRCDTILVMETIKLTHDATQTVFFRKWHPHREEFFGDGGSIPEDVWLDVELALCDKRKRGYSEGYSWEIVKVIHDYRWIGLGFIEG